MVHIIILTILTITIIITITTTFQILITELTRTWPHTQQSVTVDGYIYNMNNNNNNNNDDDDGSSYLVLLLVGFLDGECVR